jgi:hypothetical protein
MTTVLKPFRASAVEKAALVVVLPTPPFPEVTTTILAKLITLKKIDDRKTLPEYL